MAIITAMLLALRTVMIKFGTGSMSIWPLLFWIGLGQGILSLLLFAFHHPHIMEKAKAGVVHLIFVAVLANIGLISFVFALSFGPVTLVSALIQLQPFFVLLLVISTTMYFPKILTEELSRHNLMQKGLATFLVFVGLILIL